MGGHNQHCQSTEVTLIHNHGVPVCNYEMLRKFGILTMDFIVHVVCI